MSVWEVHLLKSLLLREKNPGAKWKMFGSLPVIWKDFNKEVCVCPGRQQPNKIQSPKENKLIFLILIGLIQKLLVF